MANSNGKTINTIETITLIKRGIVMNTNYIIVMGDPEDTMKDVQDVILERALEETKQDGLLLLTIVNTSIPFKDVEDLLKDNGYNAAMLTNTLIKAETI